MGEVFKLHLLVVFFLVALAITIETGILLPYLGVGAAAGGDSAEQLLQLGSVIGCVVATVIGKVFNHRPDENLQNLQEIV